VLLALRARRVIKVLREIKGYKECKAYRVKRVLLDLRALRASRVYRGFKVRQAPRALLGHREYKVSLVWMELMELMGRTVLVFQQEEQLAKR
jgi:hypothetical protein